MSMKSELGKLFDSWCETDAGKIRLLFTTRDEAEEIYLSGAEAHSKVLEKQRLRRITANKEKAHGQGRFSTTILCPGDKI